MDSPSCTEKCKSLQHGDVICTALTKREISDVELCAFFNQVCCCCESVRDTWGRTALHLAASVGRTDVVKWLLRRKQINLNARDVESGYTALHRSIFYGRINCAVELLRAGANSNTYDYENLTCLDHAMKNSNPLKTNYYDGEIYVWGSNMNYIFGMQQARHSPELWDTFHKEHPREAIRRISLGKFHCMMVTREGNAYTCGHGQGGRLGLGSEQTILTPKLVKFADSQRQQVHFYCIQASVARDHTVFLTELDDVNYVWSCGLNTHHVLGISPPPAKSFSPKRLTKFKHKIYGVCAARYHSVAWGPKAVFTWGLHGGQLGHDQNGDKYITVPKLVTCLTKMKAAIQEVVASSGATVVATMAGDIFVLHEYQRRKISSRQKILNLAVTGGRLNTSLDSQLSAEKNAELKILVLTESGRIFLWQESDPQLCRCVLSLNREIFVTQVVMNACEILFVDADYEAFHGTIKNRRKKSVEGNLTTARNSFHKFLEKDECHSVKLTKLPKVHRAVFVATDSKGKNFAVIQTDPRNGLRELPSVVPGTLTADFSTLLNEAEESDYVHDISFKLSKEIFPAHRYVVASVSLKLKKMTEKSQIEIDGVRPEIFRELLLWIYTGKCSLLEVGKCPKQFLRKNMSIDKNGEDKAFLKTMGDNKNGEEKVDPVRALQELAKRLELTELEQRLAKLTIKEDAIVYSKQFEEEFLFGDGGRKFFDRLALPDLYDVTIRSKDGQSLRAHKCILVARVDFFQRLYSIRWKNETTKCDISLPYNKNVLDLFLEFVYTDELFPNQGTELEILQSLLILSDEFFMAKLKGICERLLCTLLSFKNAIQLLKIADVYNAKNLKAFVMEFICLNLGAFLESRCLENLEDDSLNQLTAFYCAFNSKIQNQRVITPYSTAPSDEEIKNVSNLYPISLDLDENLAQSKTKTLKKRNRPHKSAVGNSNSAEAAVPEILLEEKTCADLDTPSTSTPVRLQAITNAHEKIKLEHDMINFVKLAQNQSDDVYSSSFEDFPLLASSSSAGSSSTNKVKYEKINSKHKVQKISQKQRKRLFSEESVKETTTTASVSVSPKNPWKICDCPSPIGSPDSPLQANIDVIISEEKKSKENFNKMITKPLVYTQMEDKAIEDLQKFYNSDIAIEEVITTERVSVGFVSLPKWVQKFK